MMIASMTFKNEDFSSLKTTEACSLFLHVVVEGSLAVILVSLEVRSSLSSEVNFSIRDQTSPYLS